jgi:lycopene beta-cyclase
MPAHDYDVAIAGGGLAGGLAALALARAAPDLRVALIEAGMQLGGRHRWSWFASDLAGDAAALMDLFTPTRWDAGSDVRFPALTRTLTTPYRSLSSDAFAATLAQLLPGGAIRVGTPVASLDAGSVTFANGARITAGTVIDARGIGDASALTGGWQVFVGQTIRTDTPHGVTRPTIMDATVQQLGGYRFVYVLPLDPHTIFVEDTYYADTRDIDRAELGGRIAAYAAQRGWNGRVIEEEAGALPVVTGGDFSAFAAAHAAPGVVRLGVRGGFFHPLTSYSLPLAAANAVDLARQLRAGVVGSQLAETVSNRAAQHWRAGGFYRMLGMMLMQAGAPAQRWRIFERFYGLPEPLIERFYAGVSTLADKARVLAGKPPVPVLGALRALTSGGRHLGEAA